MTYIFNEGQLWRSRYERKLPWYERLLEVGIEISVLAAFAWIVCNIGLLAIALLK